MIKNNKGFMMAEVIIVSSIVLIVLSNFVFSYMNIYSKYEERVSYYDISNLYRLAYYRDYLIESPNINGDNSLINTALQSARDNIIEIIYGFDKNLIASERINQIDGYKDKVLLVYDPKNNLNSSIIEGKIINNSGEKINVTFKNYIDFLSSSTEFESTYILLSERCEIDNENNCTYAYLDVLGND